MDELQRLRAENSQLKENLERCSKSLTTAISEREGKMVQCRRLQSRCAVAERLLNALLRKFEAVREESLLWAKEWGSE